MTANRLAPRLLRATGVLSFPVAQGECFFEAAQDVGWDQRRFTAPARQQFSMFHNGGPTLEASWSHPTLKKAMALPVAACSSFRPQTFAILSRLRGDDLVAGMSFFQRRPQ